MFLLWRLDRFTLLLLLFRDYGILQKQIDFAVVHFGILFFEHGMIRVLRALFFKFSFLSYGEISLDDVLDSGSEFLPLTIDTHIKNSVVMHLGMDLVRLFDDCTHTEFEGFDCLLF